MCNCAEEKKFVGNNKIHKGGPLRPYDLGRMPLQPVKNYKSQLSFGGHPNFMHPFEYVGKSFLDKLFTKRIGTITQTKP